MKYLSRYLNQRQEDVHAWQLAHRESCAWPKAKGPVEGAVGRFCMSTTIGFVRLINGGDKLGVPSVLIENDPEGMLGINGERKPEVDG